MSKQGIVSRHPSSVVSIPPSPISRFFFISTKSALIWLIIRLYVGYEWLSSGWQKVTGFSIDFETFGQSARNGVWVFGPNDGAAVRGFVMGALQKTTGENPAVQGWYAAFLENFVLPNAAAFAYVIAFGELLVGLGLIVGCLTGIAAFFGIFMNANYLLAGSIGLNPILATLSILLLLAWRVAGYYGLDRYMLLWLGTPWTGPWYRNTHTKSKPSVAIAPTT